jgi:HSP20 family protein
MSERARAHAATPEEATAPAGVGLEAIMDALGTMLRQVEGLAKHGDSLKEFASPDGKLRAVVGCTVRVGEGGAGRAEIAPFGHVARATPERPPVAREPLAEIFEEGERLRVVAEMPGVAPDQVALRVEGAELVIEAAGAPPWHTRLALPAPVRADAIAHTLRNGILEATLPVAGEAP